MQEQCLHDIPVPGLVAVRSSATRMLLLADMQSHADGSMVCRGRCCWCCSRSATPWSTC